MRAVDFMEKRQSKRIDLSLPINVNRGAADKKREVQEGLTLNLSYHGAYVINIDIKNIKPQDKINIYLSVPKDDRRDFPFSRLTGEAEVVRVEKDGVGLRFGEDMSRLFAAN